MADMCRLCVLVESIPGHGSLGGEVSQYQVDFAEKTPRKLGDLYRSEDLQLEHIFIKELDHLSADSVCPSSVSSSKLVFS